MQSRAIGSPAFKRILAWNIAIPLLLSLVLCTAFIVLLLNLMAVSKDVNTANRAVAKANEIGRLVADAETGLRGFLLTGKGVYLKNYSATLPLVDQVTGDLKELVATDPNQTARIEKALSLLQQWTVLAQTSAANRRKNGRDNPEDFDARRVKMDELRAEIAAFAASADTDRDQRANRAERLTNLAIFLIVSFFLALGAIIAYFGRYQLLSISRNYENALTTQLKQNQILEALGWKRSGQALLAEAIRGDLSVEEVAARSLTFILDYTGATAGVVYRSDADNTSLYKLTSLGSVSETPERIKLNESLAGRVLASGAPTVLSDIPSGYFRVASALGDATPRSLLIAPFKSDGRPQGVIELGYMDSTPSPQVLEFLDESANLVGTALRSAAYRSKLQDLLHESQQLTEELQAQQEELRVSNEELSERTRILQETQSRLESQHAELEQTNEQLEEQAELLEQQKRHLDERNQSLSRAQADIEKSARDLEKASRYKSEFLANMSHELRTPLNSSLILAKLLKDNPDGNLSPEQVEFASTIYNAGNDLLTLINDILDLSKVEAGQLEIVPETVYVSKLLSSLEKTFRPLASEKGLSLDILQDNDVPEVIETDRQRIEQILRNLLSNAIKFTNQGSVRLTVKASDKNNLRFDVTDTGVGIEPSHREIIFEAFKQADGTTNRKYGGTGLGLSISKNLAHLLGGEITVESVLGKGSTFTFVVPRTYGAVSVPQSQPTTPKNVPQEKSPAQPAVVEPAQPVFLADDRQKITSSGGRTLLIVEDELNFARVLYDLGHEMGFSCIVTDRVSEAQKLAIQHRPAGVILDMKLPDASGLSLLDQLKAEPKTRHIPVQAVSAADLSREALHMGAIGYAMKPADLETLKTAFRKLDEKINQRTKRVLIIEDDPIQRSSIEKLIGENNVEIVSTGSGAEGLEKLKHMPFECAIIDLTLPDMTGFDLLERLANEQNMTFPPVIVYTGKSLSRAEEERLARYSRTIIIKGARSPERLLDEVTLFLHQADSNLSPERKKILSAVRHRERSFEGRRILLTDDDVRNIFALTSALELKGASVVIARNGRQALERLDQEPNIDLVLMDIMMPEMDGYQAIQEIRKQNRFKRLPIIAVTAKAMQDDYEKCLAAGANDYLAKPVDIDRLVSLMRVWLPKAYGRA